MSSTPAHLTEFQPSRHGFSFGNNFRHQNLGPVTMRGWSSGICQVALDFFHAGRTSPAIDVVDFGTRPVSGVGVASWSADRVDLFVRRDDGRVATKHLESGRFTDWQDLARYEISLAPAAASWGPDRMDVLVRGVDGRLWHQWYDSGWAGAGGICRPLPDFAEDLGAVAGSAAAVATPRANRIETYVCGADGDLWFRCHDGGAWHDWECLGRPDGLTLTGEPTAAGQTGWMTVLARGSDNAIWQKEWAGNRWQRWRSLGGQATSAPAVASPFPGRAEAYVRGADGNMYLSIATGRRWEGWKSIGAPPPGLSTERPAAVSHRGIMDVYALANDQTVWHKRWSNGWRPWQSTELAIGITSRALTDAIHHRHLADTVTPLRTAIPHGSAGLAAAGTAGRFALPHAPFADELSKLDGALREGSPISVGLLSSDALGHEVVVYGGTIDPVHESTLYVYDPCYPRCDQMTIAVDPVTGAIRSASGETWQSLWVRDDVERRIPPI